ncbi:hypothetical protein BpHYR1_044550 [Brachionus plicatilis]|uniref:Uncharacterized protein n=1 Tax=Brachionus plicatilis TaxID=10195 RepID=A0A3M7R1P8_BRAPC|nr:hypothetical protein BpHYR1_044550 [Brachionus plicatilis]
MLSIKLFLSLEAPSKQASNQMTIISLLSFLILNDRLEQCAGATIVGPIFHLFHLLMMFRFSGHDARVGPSAKIQHRFMGLDRIDRIAASDANSVLAVIITKLSVECRERERERDKISV